jgi:hypothetical protein
VIVHHPWVTAGIAWWALLSVIVRLDPAALLVGLLPTCAVIVQYFLAKRTAKQLARQALAKVQEVHTLVNSQHEAVTNEAVELRALLTAANQRIDALTDVIAVSTPPNPSQPSGS